MTPAQITRADSEQLQRRAQKLFSMIEQAGDQGRTLGELVQTLSGELKPSTEAYRPVGRALAALALSGRIRPTGVFRNKTTILTSAEARVQYELTGGEVWAVWNPGEKASTAGAPRRVTRTESPRPAPLRGVPRQRPRPKHTHNDDPFDLF
ncbi:MAG: hypothetical protein ACPG77_14545 [Nannocystaceae bacterium]